VHKIFRLLIAMVTFSFVQLSNAAFLEEKRPHLLDPSPYYTDVKIRNLILESLKEQYGDISKAKDIIIDASAGLYGDSDDFRTCLFPEDELLVTVKVRVKDSRLGLTNSYFLVNTLIVPDKILKTGDLSLVKSTIKSVGDVTTCVNSR